LNKLTANKHGLVHVIKTPWTNKWSSTYCRVQNSE